jgi:periplasmic protein TonB
MPAKVSKRPSPIAFLAVAGLHATVLLWLLHYEPRFSAAQADVMHVSLITPPAPLPIEQPPASPQPKPKPVQKKVQRVMAPPPPVEAPSEAAISVPPAPPTPPAPEEPASVIASAAASPPAPPAPLVLPRFDADYLRNPPPAYPALSRRVGEQGKVLLRVVVRPDGTPDSVVLRQSSGSARLDEAALEAVRKWRFVPARQGNTPVSAAVIVPIVFSLEG